MSGSATTRRQPFGDNPRVGARGSETERRILEAALDVFGEKGFSEARVEFITERAGCSRPAFYQYFSSKEEVFWKLAGDVGRELVALGRSLKPVTPDRSGINALAEWMNEFTDLFVAYTPVFVAFQAATHDQIETARTSSSVGNRLDLALLKAFGVHDDPQQRALASGMAAVIIRCTFYWRALAATGAMERERLISGLSRATHRLFFGLIDGVNIEGGPRPHPSSDTAPKLVAPPLTDDGSDLRPRGFATRQRILDAGASVLPVRGYHNARIDDIVSAADVSHGTFYRYFPDKDAFFRALAEQATAQMIPLLDRLPLNDDSEALRAWLHDWFESYRTNGGVITTWQEMQESRGELVEYSQDVGAKILFGLVDVLDHHGHDDALFDALVLLALIERLPYRAYTLGFTSADDAIDAGVTIIRRSVLGFAA